MQTDAHAATDPQDTPPGLSLDPAAARVLACLVEKEATTPDQYPLTLNAATLACNQKSNREPVMALEPGEVGHALRQLERLGLVKSNYSARAERFEHRMAQGLGITEAQQAALTALVLRGPQTAAEVVARSERLLRQPDADALRHALDRLCERTPALALRLPRASGQREERFVHLLSGAPDPETLAAAAAAGGGAARATADPALESRVAALEHDVAALRARLDALLETLGG